MKQKSRVQLADFESLFDDDTDTFGHDVQKMSVTEKEVSIDKLHDFMNHPFPVVDDEELDNLTSSIKEHGVLHSVIVRKDNRNGYEIISGHRRCRAAEKAGLTSVPVKIVEMDDDEATACMVEANFRQRESIPISVKAKAYRMEYDALKHQGKNKGMWSINQMGDAAGESGKTVQRYIRLSYLINDLLELADTGKLGILQGVELSYLTEDNQFTVLVAIQETNVKMTVEQASQIRERASKGVLILEQVILMLTGIKVKTERLKLNEKSIRSYFPENYSNNDIEKVIFSLLEKWKEGQKDG